MNKHHSISVNFSLYFLVKNFNDCSLMIPCLRMWQSLHARACDDPNVTNFLFVTKTAEAFENKRLSSPARNMQVQYCNDESPIHVFCSQFIFKLQHTNPDRMFF